jgi:hypothetical protein
MAGEHRRRLGEQLGRRSGHGVVGELGVQPPGPDDEAPVGVGRSDTRGALTTTRRPGSTGRADEGSGRVLRADRHAQLAEHGRDRGAGGHDDGVRVDLRPVGEPDAVRPARRRPAAPTRLVA